jgi:FimV-like protein
MPNGGSDHCGNCRHNRVNIGRESTRDERSGPAFCAVRNVEIPASGSTYCANHYTGERAPIGPIFSEHGEHVRIPYHDGARPKWSNSGACEICGSAPPGPDGVVIPASAGPLHFCGAPHYVRWWKQSHPGEALTWDADTPSLTPEQERRRDMSASLQLARAYIAMGDVQGARQALASERWTDAELGEEARSLLASLEL